MTALDPKFRSKFRFIVRGGDATWRKPHDRKPGDVDVTDIDDEEELAAIFVRERDKVAKSPASAESVPSR
jgi:hypothetical protein